MHISASAVFVLRGKEKSLVFLGVRRNPSKTDVKINAAVCGYWFHRSLSVGLNMGFVFVLFNDTWSQ